MTKTLKILFVILAITIFGGETFFYYQIKKQSQESDIKTLRWKTYQNERYGFIIKYPKSWKIEEIQEEIFSVGFTSPEMSEKIEKGVPDAGAEITLSIEKNSNNLTLDQFIENYAGGREMVLSKSSITIGDIPGFKCILNGMVPLTDYFWARDSQVFILDAFSEEDIQSEMLSTFKFI